jgi:hypothetical protein
MLNLLLSGRAGGRRVLLIAKKSYNDKSVDQPLAIKIKKWGVPIAGAILLLILNHRSRSMANVCYSYRRQRN